MPQAIKWQTILTSRGNVLFTELNSLGDNAFSSAGSEIDNTTNLDQYVWFEFVCSFTVAPSDANPYIALYWISALDGTNYESNPTAQKDFINLLAKIPVRKVTATQNKHIGPFALPPIKIKFLAENQTGTAMAGSSNRFEMWTNNNEMQ